MLMIRFFSFIFVLSFSLVSFKNYNEIICEKALDIPGIIEYFTLDAADVATIQKWNIGVSSKSPIKWSDTEPQWDGATSTYTKSGTVILNVEGVPTTFTVILSGTKIIVNRVQLNLSRSATVPIFELEKILNNAGITTNYIKCENLMPKGFGTLAYSMLIPNKKEAWVAYTWQCLKGECSANINIYFEKETVEKLPCY